MEGYLKGDNFEAVRLSYGSGAYQFYAFLPKKDMPLAQLISQLDGKIWQTWRSKFRDTEVIVSLPRFSVKFEEEMQEPLASLGMAPAFQDAADFSPMGLGLHKIDEVKHIAVLEVNEEGTEAAAATAVGITVTSIVEPTRVVFDRPFFCAIVHQDTGAILFSGAAYQPKAL